MPIAIDLELTNRCNADCWFCPRDQTPHQGLMSVDVFGQALRRAIEYRSMLHEFGDLDVQVNLCGLGEPLLNRNAPDFVRSVHEAGIDCGLSSNGALLDERRGSALLDAGLQHIFINASETDDDYEDVYGLPFEKTLSNIERFVVMAEGRCDVSIVLVDHRVDPHHLERMREFWRARGVQRFMTFDVINRGGALFVDTMQYEQFPELAQARAMLDVDGRPAVCPVPFVSLFVGYDGQYYLCCSDWRKQAPMGTVFDESFLSVTHAKLEHVTSREPVCKSCNHDPANRLAEELRAVNAGESDDARVAELTESIRDTTRNLQQGIDALLGYEALRGGDGARRRIPLRVE